MLDKWLNYLKDVHFSIATMHQKERVIGPLFFTTLGAVGRVPENLNTDLLGTFSGEIEREGNMLTVARKKCLMAMDLLGLNVGIASEGSFGPHPEFGFMPAAIECILFIDLKNDLEIHENIVTPETNFSRRMVNSEAELKEFASLSGFPAHGLIMRNGDGESDLIFKGLQNEEKLMDAFYTLKKEYGTAFAETDMRAMYNPTRMKMISHCTQKLIKKIKSTCPDCNKPGFAVTDVITGLPCRLCAVPTRSVLAHVYLCSGCGCRKEIIFPENKQFEDPMYCDNCNP